MNQHTPAPWEFDEDEAEIHAVDFVDDGGDPAHICELLGTNKKANGQLIAAAPAMLAALKAVQALALPGATNIHSIVAAAIAQAEGVT